MTEMHFKSPFLKEAKARGFIHQCTDFEALDEKMAQEKVVAYIGYDATATSLQVGNLVTIRFLRLFQKHGHKPIILVGGGTSKIGDPSGKDAERKVLTDEILQKNIQGIRDTFVKYLDFDGENGAILLNNDEWLDNLNYIHFLRDYGRHFSVNRMLSFESVKQRLEREQPLSFLEFNYMIFQAYDFMYLNQKYDCALQMGGADQWGNIINGVELTRRKNNKTVFGLTAPLLTTSTGKKMGKTADGAVWLNAENLSPYEYWQYWRNVDDADVLRFMRIFTDISIQEIDSFEQKTGSELNSLKVMLADHVTAINHGAASLTEIHNRIASLFQGGGNDDWSTLEHLEITVPDLSEKTIEDWFVAAGLAKSKGEVRRLIDGRGARLNDQTIEDAKLHIHEAEFKNGYVKLSAGKKKHFALKLI